MQNRWYADNRDLVKWSILLLLAGKFSVDHILQIAYFREYVFPNITLNNQEQSIPEAALSHFRDTNKIERLSSKIKVFNHVIGDREQYLCAAKKFIAKYSKGSCIVSLDPDTGLEPQGLASLNHVLNEEAKDFWEALKKGDIIVLYQHQTNRNGNEWIEPKRNQFAEAIDVSIDAVKVGSGQELAKDIVLFYAVKT